MNEASLFVPLLNLCTSIEPIVAIEAESCTLTGADLLKWFGWEAERALSEGVVRIPVPPEHVNFKIWRPKGWVETLEEQPQELLLYEDERGKIHVNYDVVAERIIQSFDLLTVYGLREEKIYAYTDGIWEPTGRGVINAETENLLHRAAKNNVVNEVVGKIKRMTEIPVEDFNKIPDGRTPVNNGVLDISNPDHIIFERHRKENYFKAKFPVDWVPAAQCPAIMNFFKMTFYPEDIPQVQEWFGHHLVVNKYLFKKADIIHGQADTGKTVFVNLLKVWLGGEKNVSDIGLQEISNGDSMDLYFLKNKFANIHDDLSSEDLSNAGGFKMAVGDGSIPIEEKFGDRGSIRNTAKHTFTCNRVPGIKDIDDDAYYGRWLLWRLDNKVPAAEQDKELIKKLTTPEELSGLLNWAIEGYRRLIKNKVFTNEKTAAEMKDLMALKGSSLAQFAIECLEEADGNKISKKLMHVIYSKFCADSKPRLAPSSIEQLGRQLPRYAPYIISGHGKDRYWNNAALKPVYAEKYAKLKDTSVDDFEDIDTEQQHIE